MAVASFSALAMMAVVLIVFPCNLVSSASVPRFPVKSLTPFMTMRQVGGFVSVPSIPDMQSRNLRLSDIAPAEIGTGGGGPVQPDAPLPPAGVPDTPDSDTAPQPERGPNSPRVPNPLASPLPKKAATAPQKVARKSRTVPGFRVRCYPNDRFRTVSGECNNLFIPTLGAANTPFIVLSRRGRNTNRPLPNPRVISNIVCAETQVKPNKRRMSTLVTFMGQFFDHVVTETATVGGTPLKIPIPANDPVFKPPQFIPFFPTVQVGTGRRRAPNNELSSYIDAAAVYGVEEKVTNALREMRGGRMKLPGGLLPRAANGQFAAGDKRAGENPNLTSIHLLFAREHNTIAKEVSTAFPTYNDEQIFQLARHILIAKLQAILYYEFIPALTGRPLRRYRRYKPWVPARISNRWSTVGFRVGHTLLNSEVPYINAAGVVRKLMLSKVFFKPEAFVQAGFDNLVRGIIRTQANEIDNELSDEVRNNLFPDSTTPQQLDLASLNIQRGRDHGVPKCNDLRFSLRLRPFRSFLEMAGGDFAVANKLKTAYNGKISDVDPWVCGISEKHRRGSSLGSMFHKIVRNDFRRLRDGDRFYFERPGYFTREEIRKIPTARNLAFKRFRGLMKSVIVRNTELTASQVKTNPFFV